MTRPLPLLLALVLPLAGACSGSGGDAEPLGEDSGSGPGSGAGGAGDDTAGDDTGGDPFAGPPEVHLPTTGLTADQLAVVINTDDPLSAEVAHAYVKQRGLTESQVFELSLGTAAQLSEADFAVAKAELDAALSEEHQALLLAFTVPYQVSCMGTSAAFALGFDEGYCSTPCSSTTAVDYYDSDSVAPWTDHGLRPAMMLSAPTLDEAVDLIARGVDADDTNPPGKGWMVRTSDSARSVRYGDFQQTLDRFDLDALDLEYVDNASGAGSDVLTGEEDILFYLTGLTHISDLDTNTYRPGALGDHLTSYGGVLSDANSQMPITDWLSAGLTASYGTAHEPCNYPQKFPSAEVLISQYFRGATAIEAYWKSVNWPGEGNFVGEPLARPFGHEWAWEEGTLTISTPHLDRRSEWQLEAAESAEGPWEVVLEEIGPGRFWTRVDIELPDAWARHYRLVQSE